MIFSLVRRPGNSSSSSRFSDEEVRRVRVLVATASVAEACNGDKDPATSTVAPH